MNRQTMRVKFRKGEQRRFIKHVLDNLLSPSLRALQQYGISVNYQSLKSYYSGSRTLPEGLFLELCKLADIKPETLSFVRLEDNWGRVKGGKK